MDELGLTTVRSPDAITVAVRGELDIATADQLRDHVLLFLTRSGVRSLVLNLGELSFIDSAGLDALTRIRHDALALGIELRLADPTPRLLQLLAITKTTGQYTLIHP